MTDREQDEEVFPYQHITEYKVCASTISNQETLQVPGLLVWLGITMLVQPPWLPAYSWLLRSVTKPAISILRPYSSFSVCSWNLLLHSQSLTPVGLAMVLTQHWSDLLYYHHWRLSDHFWNHLNCLQSL